MQDILTNEWNVDLAAQKDTAGVEKFVENLLWRRGRAPSEKELGFFWKAMAASLFGLDTPEGNKYCFYLVGRGNNGKTSLINVVEKMLGGDCLETNTIFRDAVDTPVVPKLEIFSDFQDFDFRILEELTETGPARRSCWLVGNSELERRNVDEGPLSRIRRLEFFAEFVPAEKHDFTKRADPRADKLPADHNLVERVLSPEGIHAFFSLLLEGREAFLKEGLSQ